MLQFKDDPKKLMFSLDRFLSVYFGDRQIESKRELSEISAWKIPDLLKHFYSFAEKYPGVIDLQDGFLINNGKDTMTNYCGKLYIHESDLWGSWPRFFVKIKEKDLCVWVSYGREYEPLTERFVCDSLSQFLVTFTLEQALFGTTYFYNFAKIHQGIKLNNLLSAIKKQEHEVYLLWETNNFWNIVHNRTYQMKSFYSVEDAILICSNGFCATNYKNADRLLSSILLG